MSTLTKPFTLVPIIGLALNLLLSACQAPVPAVISYVSEIPNLAPNGISDSEWETAALHFNQQAFDLLDTDHNGAVSLAEFNAGSGKTAKLTSFKDSPYPDLDSDNDGIWQASEFTQFALTFGKIKDSASLDSFLLTAYIVKQAVNKAWTVADTDKNGTLSVEELKAHPADKNQICETAAACNGSQAFDKMDANHDQIVSYGEYQRNVLAFWKQFTQMLQAANKTAA